MGCSATNMRTAVGRFRYPCYTDIYIQPPNFPRSQGVADNSSLFLSLPEPLNSLRNTNIIRLKLVQPNQHQHCGALETPHECLPHGWMLAFGDVVDDNGFEPKVRVDDDSGTENCVGDGADGAGGERSDS